MAIGFDFGRFRLRGLFGGAIAYLFGLILRVRSRFEEVFGMAIALCFEGFVWVCDRVFTWFGLRMRSPFFGWFGGAIAFLEFRLVRGAKLF